ncbi:ScbR family autoregulator-binding transcription factor [Kibdelosporangium phytohabitans]|uniref:ScbR family autoregulator-binding transcription factor n=1 Tax=Kibdelosporangium phytohabitans TaxID=860235 RepID=UPI001470534F|nr:ScbR family autoregulator-binding transcription factor [Kibdelosporangium phytohabitans]
MNGKRTGWQTRGDLVAAAAEVFDRDGFTGASLHDVCARAEVSKGALYCHFPSKNALALAVIERQSLLWHEVRYELGDRGGMPTQTLVDFSFELAERMCADPVLRAGSRLVLEAGLFEVAAASQFAGSVAIVRDLLRDAEKAGELLSGTDVRYAAEAIVAELTGTHLLSLAMAGETELPARLPQMWRLRLLGLVHERVRVRLRLAPQPPHSMSKGPVSKR